MIKNICGRNILFEVSQGDITGEDVDAIVNAAHERLQGGGGVDGAIHRAAGPKLCQACRDFPEVERGVRCRVGEAFITPGFRLKAKYVIHTVAPKFVGSASRVVQESPDNPFKFTIGNNSLMKTLYQGAKEGTDEDMAKCYESCIMLADENSVKSIAFPALGCGGHAYPMEIACPIAIATTIKTLEKTSNISHVKFVCFSEFDYNTYVMEMENYE